MAEITQGFHIVYGGTTLTATPSMVSASWTKITASSKDLCIKDFPDMDNADKDQVETTTLCDTAHQYIDGLDNLPDNLEFTANFDEDLFDEVNTNKSAEAWWGLQKGEPTASPSTKAPIWYFKGKAKMILKGAGVGDVAEMTLRIRPTSVIEKDEVATS